MVNIHMHIVGFKQLKVIRSNMMQCLFQLNLVDLHLIIIKRLNFPTAFPIPNMSSNISLVQMLLKIT